MIAKFKRIEYSTNRFFLDCMHVGQQSTSDVEPCTSTTFPNQLEPEESLPLDGRRRKWQTILIPKMRFTCDDTISIAELTVVGKLIKNGTSNPTLQLWRQRNTRLRYRLRRGSSNMIELNPVECECCSRLNVSESEELDLVQCTFPGTITDDIQVQAGDIIGIEIPPKADTSFEIYFSNSTEVNLLFFRRQYTPGDNITLSDNNMIVSNKQPQIKLEIVPTSGKPSTIMIFTRFMIHE